MRGPVPIICLTALSIGTFLAATGSTASASIVDPEIRDVGEIQTLTFQSEVLGEERTLRVRRPQGYEDGVERYPVLLVLDAEWHFDLAAADVGLLSECSYIEPHPVPRLLVVGIDNVDRNRDFTPTHCPDWNGMSFPTSGGAARFRRFLAEEVIPLIDTTYRTQPFRILSGWSLGGLFTVQTVLGEAAFDSYLAISPSLWWDDELTLKQLSEDRAGTRLDRPRQLVITLGTVEIAAGSSVAKATQNLRSYLEEHPLAHLSLESVEIEGLGHTYSPKMAFFYGLATIFADLTPPEEILEGGLSAIDAYYTTLTERYHAEMPVPEDIYSRLGWRLFEAGQEHEAGEVFRRWAERHPDSALAQASLGSFCRETGDTERAVRLLRRAIDLEERSQSPRLAFVHDLRRDINALEGRDPE